MTTITLPQALLVVLPATAVAVLLCLAMVQSLTRAIKASVQSLHDWRPPIVVGNSITLIEATRDLERISQAPLVAITVKSTLHPKAGRDMEVVYSWYAHDANNRTKDFASLDELLEDVRRHYSGEQPYQRPAVDCVVDAPAA